MNNLFKTSIIATILAMSASLNLSLAHEGGHDIKMDKLALENLSRDTLAGVENTEVIVSRVVVPPNTSLPKHWHPGEEFAYILEGEVTLWQEGKSDTILKAGDTGKVPLKQVHTAVTKDKGAVILVFRVHENGKQERYLVK